MRIFILQLLHGDFCNTICHKPTYAVQQTVPLFNYLIGDCEHVGWDAEPKRPGGLQVDDDLVPGRRLHRELGRLLALEDAVDVAGCLPELVDVIRPPSRA